MVLSMRGSWTSLLIVGALTVAAGVALQWQTGAALRRELELLRTGHGELERLRVENRRLTDAQVAPAELENLRSDHTALAGLRAELEVLKNQPVLVAAPPL